MNLTDKIYDIAERTPTRLLFIDNNKMNYRDFCALIDKFIINLQNKGVNKGSRCIVLLPPSVNMFALTLSLIRIGAVPVMIDPGMGLKAMFNALQDAEAKFLIATPKIIPAFLVFPKQLKSISKTLYIRKGKNGKTGILPFTKKKQLQPYHVHRPKNNDLAAIFFTSGSTGPAKGVMYEHKQLQSQLEILERDFAYHTSKIDYCTFPLIGFFSICLGLQIVLARMNMTKPSNLNPKLLIHDLNKYHCSLMFCSPLVMKKLSDHAIQNRLKLPYLKEINIAGAAVSTLELTRLRSIVDENCTINTPYGATEALPLTKINDRQIEIACSKRCIGVCIGKELPLSRIKIIENTEDRIESLSQIKECNNFEIGELLVYGPQVTQKYLQNDLANELSKVYDKANESYWHRMGDLGYKDEFGRVFLVGRKTHQLRIGETTLNTIPTEHYFNRHPYILRSGLVSVDKGRAKIPVLCIELTKKGKENKNLIQELKAMANEEKDTSIIDHFIIIRKLPVDPRHNAKIFREKLAIWAQKRI
jgi:acyl-coenzyme A synthetase/AMP-(fatty) acid ligase